MIFGHSCYAIVMLEQTQHPSAVSELANQIIFNKICWLQPVRLIQGGGRGEGQIIVNSPCTIVHYYMIFGRSCYAIVMLEQTQHPSAVC